MTMQQTTLMFSLSAENQSLYIPDDSFHMFDDQGYIFGLLSLEMSCDSTLYPAFCFWVTMVETAFMTHYNLEQEDNILSRMM
jgi:hypothetical protein